MDTERERDNERDGEEKKIRERAGEIEFRR